MLKDSDVVAAKKCVSVLIDSYKKVRRRLTANYCNILSIDSCCKGIWNDVRTVNVIAQATYVVLFPQCIIVTLCTRVCPLCFTVTRGPGMRKIRVYVFPLSTFFLGTTRRMKWRAMVLLLLILMIMMLMMMLMIMIMMITTPIISVTFISFRPCR
jgi:hypothetical protein